MIKASIIGANGYTGLELMLILSRHKDIEIDYVVSRSMAGSAVTDLYPSLYNLKDKQFVEHDIEKIAQSSQLVFLCLPHTTSFDIAERYIKLGVKVVDLSADFRYNNTDTYQKWYKTPHLNPQLNKQAVYGLCELYADRIKGASLVANPGCYTTSAILPLYPLLKENLIKEDNIIIDAKSGVSGAGRKLENNLLFTEVANNFKAYGLTSHRHTSEIEEQLSIACKEDIVVSFSPHLLPIKRGILSTIYGNLKSNVEAEDILNAFKKYYSDKQFITILEQGELPQLNSVVGSNKCEIGFCIDSRLNRVIIVSVIDNLIKGASGQAVQNANLMFGFAENEALDFMGRYL